jgi:hypothetical protein
LRAGPASVQCETRVTRIAPGGRWRWLLESLAMSSKSRALVGPQPRRTFFALASVLSALLSGCCRSCYRRFMYGMNERKRAHFSCNRPNPRPARRKGASVCQSRKSTFSKRHGVFVTSATHLAPTTTRSVTGMGGAFLLYVPRCKHFHQTLPVPSSRPIT